MDQSELKKLQWRCRRGILENDILLERFLAKHAARLSGERLKAFEALLDYTDNELRDVVCGKREAGDPALAEIVQMLRSC